MLFFGGDGKEMEMVELYFGFRFVIGAAWLLVVVLCGIVQLFGRFRCEGPSGRFYPQGGDGNRFVLSW